MKNLYVKKLFLYPRFHVDIESALDKFKVGFELPLLIKSFCNENKFDSLK